MMGLKQKKTFFITFTDTGFPKEFIDLFEKKLVEMCRKYCMVVLKF